MRTATAGKAQVLILIILTVVFAALAGVGFYLEETERKQRTRLESEVVQLSQTNTTLKEDIQSVRVELTRVEEDLIAVQEEHRRTTTLLQETRRMEAELQQVVTERDDTIVTLTAELESTQQERGQLKQLTKRLESKAQQLQGRLTLIEQENADLELQLDGTGSSVTLDRLVVGPTGDAPFVGGVIVPAPILEETRSGILLTGRILVVNREYDFVVINMGKASGIHMGDEFDVMRGSQMLGRVKVEKLYEALAAAAMVGDTNKEQLREGDTVRSVMMSASAS
jgi:hypothetical protein